MNPILLNAIRASGVIADWWRAGGAPEPVAVYQPIDAASLADSYLRIAGSGGNANLDPAVVGIGVAPTHSPEMGWAFNGINQFLDSGVVPVAGTNAVVIRYTDFAQSFVQTLMGCYQLAGDYGFRINQQTATEFRYANGINYLQQPPLLLAGVISMAGGTIYHNGIAQSGTIPTGTTPNISSFIATLNSSGTPINFASVKIQAISFWGTSADHATWVPAVSAAVAALTG